MMLGGLFGSLAAYILLTAFTASTEDHPSLSYEVIVSIFLFNIIFAWGFTPLQTLYAVECLENRTRAKGLGLNFLFLNIAIAIAMVVNTYGISVGIASIGRKLYIVYLYGFVSKSPSSTSSLSKRLEKHWRKWIQFSMLPTQGKRVRRKQAWRLTSLEE